MGAIGTGILLLSMMVSTPFQKILPEKICTIMGSALLFGIGLLSVFQNSLKAFLAKKQDAQKEMRFRWRGISFAITIYIDETQVDTDHSKTLSLREAAMLGCILSLDSFGIGLGSGFSEHHYLFLAVFSLLLHPAAILLSYRLGSRAARRLPKSCSVFGGVLLMGLAISRLLG